MPKPGDKSNYTSEELERVRRHQLKAHFALYLIGWLIWPIGGRHLLALVTFHRDAGWYYAGNVGDARTYVMSGPFRTKAMAREEGDGVSWWLGYSRPRVFFLYEAPEHCYDPRRDRQSRSHLWPLFA